MNEIDKLDGMVKIKGKCGYEFIGGCKDLRTAKQKLEKIENVLQENCNQCFEIDNFSKPDDCGICEWARILKIIRGEE